MANELVSPGVSVTVGQEITSVQAQDTCVPLIIFASAAEKSHPFPDSAFTINSTVNGVACENCAVGTFEHGIIRTVTSTRQSLELYGIPRFLESDAGVPHHGDARNEYGLAALNGFLNQGRRAYAVRANVNLNDEITSVAALWEKRIDDVVDLFADLYTEYLRNYNDSNGYVPLDVDYKTTIDAAEFKTLARTAFNARAFTDYSFSNTLFQDEFLRDHGDATAGYVEVQLDDTTGFVVGTDVTGLDPDLSYQINLGINGYAPDGSLYPDASSLIEIDGIDAQTYTELVAALNTAIQAAAFNLSTLSPTIEAVVTLVNGRIRFTSSLTGVSSTVELSNDDCTSPLFVTTSLPLVVEILTPVDGRGNGALDVYTDYTYTALNITDAEFDGLDAAIDVQALIDPTFSVAQCETVIRDAATEYQYTKEFRQFTSLGANDAERRATIVAALIREIKTNDYIRNELYEHNLILCPGYPEVTTTLQEHVKSREIKEEVLVLGAVPMDKPADGPGGLLEWNAVSGVHDSGIAYYYPHSLQRNVDGKTILECSTAVALRVMAYNDFVGEPWFAPAGVRRGAAVGSDDVGYASGELGGPTDFVQVHLSEGARDNLYTQNINAIAFFPSTGLVVWGQKTTQSFAGPLDRVAASRLVKYIKRGLRKGSLSYVFEQNDRITREQFRAMAENFLNTILQRRGLYDYATICDEGNNTPERIDRQEMWLEVLIKITKQAEFIYIPIQAVATDADIGTSRTINLSRR
jgi:Phage tail sheath C-terminal domain